MNKNFKKLAKAIRETFDDVKRFDYVTVPLVSIIIPFNNTELFDLEVNKVTGEYTCFYKKYSKEFIPLSFHLDHNTNYDEEIWVGTTHNVKKIKEKETWSEEFRKLFDIMYEANLPHLGHTFARPSEVIEYYKDNI